jgi:stage II sporulation protein AA (anti-sigma F factor antagonist)
VQIETHAGSSGTQIVTLRGELDSSNAASLETAVASIAAQHPQRLIFDLSDLGFMDSAGIAVLISTATKTSVSLRNPSPIIRRVLETTGLTDVLPIES